jgi:hypothetical protein
MTLARICPCLTLNGDVPPRQQLTKPWLPLWFLFGRFGSATYPELDQPAHFDG